MPIRKNSRKNSRLSGRRRSGRKLSGGRVVRTGPKGGKYVLRAGRKVYLSGGAGCSRLRNDDCNKEDGCEWVVRKGCRSAAKKPKPAAKKPAANLSRLEEELLHTANQLRRYDKKQNVTVDNMIRSMRLRIRGVSRREETITEKVQTMEKLPQKKKTVYEKYAGVPIAEEAMKYVYVLDRLFMNVAVAEGEPYELYDEIVPAAKKKPAAKRSKGRAMSARDYVNAGGQEGDVCDIRNDGVRKCLVYRTNSRTGKKSPYWALLSAPKAQAIGCGPDLSCRK